MTKKPLLVALLALSGFAAKAAFIPVAVTGYNADVVANGPGSAVISAPQDVDGAGYAFMAPDYNPSGSTFPTRFLPATGLVNSATTAGLSFQMASYSANNSMRIAGTGTGTLTFTTPQPAGEIYVMATGGSGTCTVTMTVTFTDATTQVFTNQTVNDWYNGTNYAILGLGRVNKATNGIDNDASNPRLYQTKLTLLAANYTKNIASITFANTGAVLNVMGISINTVCTGTPTPGPAVASADYICSTESLTLTSGGASYAGLTNQWQSSTDGGVTWNDIPGANTNPYTLTGQTVVTQYRLKQNCTASSSPDVFSTPDTVFIRACYCSPSFTNGCSSWRLTNVTYGTINNSPTACATSNYTAMSNTVMAGLPNPMSITTNQYAAASVYIDLNNDGDFNDVDELLYQEPYSGQATSTVTPNITIPGYAAGRYRLRVICKWGGATGAGEACTSWPSASYGNFHDYTVNVLAAPPCATPTAQPTALTLAASATQINVAFTAATPAADRYLVVRTTGGPLTVMPTNGTSYTVGNTLGTGVVVSNSATVSFTDGGLTPATSYTYTIFANNAFCSGGPLYNTTNPLTGSISTTAAGTYSWNGSVSNDWTVPANWTPARTIPDPTDILQFNNGLVDTANNIPNQTIRRLIVGNNTAAYLQAPANNTLTIADTVTSTTDLDIAAGSSLVSNGNVGALTIAFNGANSTANIAGTMESISNAVNNVFNFTNATATVTATGTLAEGGSNAAAAIAGTTATSLQVNGLFHYKYTINAVGLPLASWNTGSTLKISGYTTATGGPNGNQNQAFYNLTYDCPNQTSVANWSGTGALTVLNNFTVASTGTGTWQYATTQAYNAQVKNYIQTGGTFDLEGASASTSQVFNVSGSFTKSGGTLKASGTTTASQPTINFNGTTAQTVSFDASPAGQFVYRVSNNAGINLVGTNGLTTFNINNNGGVRITTTAANPINTTLILAYGATNTTLYYDTAGSYTMTASVFPVAAGPQNLTISTGNSGNVVTMPFSRTIPGTLTMTSGDINLGANTLTLGTTAAAPGTLTYTAGNIRLTTGSVVRWFGTTGLPTAAGTGIGFYPVAYGGANRNVAISFDAATALSTGGTISVGHTNAGGLATVSVADGAYTIDRRTNAFWTVNATGLVLSGTNKIKMQLTGAGLFSASNPANLRVLQAATIVGTHVNGAGFTALRKDLVVTDLTSMNYYIGAALVDIGGVYVAVNNGAWSVGSTWDIGTAPTVANDAYINSGVTVTADAATNTAKSLNILSGGTLNIATGTVTIDSALQNNGNVNTTGGTLIVNGNTGLNGITNSNGALFNVASGTVRLGPVNGGNKPFTNSGTLTVSGGTLNINGNLQLNAGATFNQSGGNINVDGNAGGVAANSVASGTKIINIQTPNVNLTDGVLTIVDPHVGASTNTLEYNVATTHVNAGGNHTFRAGDGVSVDTGYNASYGFSVNTAVSSGRLAFKNVIVNSGTAANSWLVLGASSTGVLGNFTVNSGGEYRQGGTGSIVYIAGNLVNNGTYSALGTTYFGSYASGTAASAPAAQSVSGTGTFRNLLTAPTAKFYKIQVNNNANLTFNIGDVPFSNNVTLTAATGGPSRIIMPGTTVLSELAGASATSSATAGWVVGRYQKAAATGGMNNNYPIGDLNYYAPVNVSGTVATAGAVWASTTSGDHPNLGTATINPLASVNRYYTIDTLNGITFTAGTMSATLNWNAPDLDPNVTPANFVIGKYKNASWTYPAVSTPTATSIKATGLTGDVVGQYAVGEACGSINITAQPVNATACVGNTVTFRVSATPKAGLTYQWKKGATTITGATDSVYTIPAVAAGDAGNYTVVISSGCTTTTPVTSAVAVLTVNVPAAITGQPAATQNICEGSPATFSVTATGTGITYQWRKNGTIITGATSASYTIPAITTGDAASYTVDVIGVAPCGGVTSAASVLTVKPLPLTITAAGPVNFCPGGNVVLNAPATTPTNTLSYIWNRGGTPIAPSQTGQAYTATISGAYTATITNSANGCSNTSNTITVSVNGAPQSTITPAGTASFCAGSSVVLHGLNTPGLTYEWYLNGSTTPIPGATDSTYTASVAGSYTVKVSIGSGCSTTSTPTVVSSIALPTITTTPTGAQSICQNDTLTMTAFFTNATPVWKFNGAPIVPAATGTTYKATAAGSYTVTVTSTTTGCSNTSAPVTLTINPLPTVTVTSANASTFCAGGADTLKAAPRTGLTYVWNVNGTPVAPAATDSNYVATTSGSYTVTVTNSNGCKRTSTPIVVTANPLPSVAVTSSLPLSMCTGQTNNLCVPTAANQTYQWSNASGPITGATSACLAVTTAGTYSVRVVNTATGCSATSAVSTIVVNPTPTATITNTGASVACVGDTICLNANTGAGLSYQWKLNGNNIVGAVNATYCATASGNYSVTVTNSSNCSTTSAILTMTFNPRPTATISYTTPVTFCEGGAVVLTGVSNTGTTYQWQNNGAAISGATNNNYIASASGSYSVIITAPNGCSTVSPTILVVVNPTPVPVITRTGSILSTGNYASYQWYFNSAPIPGATNQSYNATQNGGYAVFVTDFNGCTNYSAVFMLNNVGVGGPHLSAAAVKVFPNPVRSTLNIKSPDPVNITLRDLTGRLLMKVDKAEQIDMSQLPDGAYMLMISDRDGIMVKTERVMKISE